MTIQRKSASEERSQIVARPAKRPYGARIRIQVPNRTCFGGVDEVCLSLHTGAFVHVSRVPSAPWEGGCKYVLALEAFSTAAAAELASRRLVQALLWTAISLDFPLRLEYSSYEPASIFQRGLSAGLQIHGSAEVGWAAEVVFPEIHDAYALLGEPDEALLLSMEILAGAGLEVSDRARFLGVVSSLEPLAEQQDLGPGIATFVAECIERIRKNETVPSDVQTALEHRLGHLKSESIRQSLRRLVQKELPERSDGFRLVDRAYAIRSQIVHNGRPDDLDVDLAHESRVLYELIRNLHARRLGRQLRAAGAG